MLLQHVDGAIVAPKCLYKTHSNTYVANKMAKKQMDWKKLFASCNGLQLLLRGFGEFEIAHIVLGNFNYQNATTRGNFVFFGTAK